MPVDVDAVLLWKVIDPQKAALALKGGVSRERLRSTRVERCVCRRGGPGHGHAPLQSQTRRSVDEHVGQPVVPGAVAPG